MAWQVPHLLGGPVLHWELIRAARQRGPMLLHYGYLAWLSVQFLLLSATRDPPLLPTEKPTITGALRKELAARTAFAVDYGSLLLYQQFLLLVLLTPAVTAGALGHEKERNTLQALFGTELGSREIVVGKLLGRVAVLARTALAALPLLVIMAVLGDLGVGPLLLALIQAAVLTWALAATCMLSSVWTRRTSDAILACYALVVLTYLVGPVVLFSTRLPAWLDPVEVLRQLSTPHAELRLVPLGLHLAAWGGGGALCLALAVAGLRPACLRQLDRRPGRWLWAFRPPVGDDPVRWRERYVIGLAPLPWLRLVPGWLALLGVLSFSAILAGTALHTSVGRGFFPALRRGEFALAVDILRHADPGRVVLEVSGMGGILLLIGTLTVAVRCGGSIAEEKRRKTWEDLILTPLGLDEIVRGKLWGVLLAAIPYLAAYALPLFALACLGGTLGIIVASAWVTGSCLIMVVAAVLGMEASADPERSGQAPGPSPARSLPRSGSHGGQGGRFRLPQG